MKKLEPMPEKPTLVDFFKYRFASPRKSSSYRARETNATPCPVFLNVAADARQKTLAPKYTKRSISKPGTDRPEYTVWLEYCGSGVAL
jgi:hypothetical protein